VKPNPFVASLAAQVRANNPTYPPEMKEVADMGADALRVQLPDLSDDEIGAVLLCAASFMGAVDVQSKGKVTGRGVINTIAILGDRLYGSIPDEPWHQ
jgi:hypothetical protein